MKKHALIFITISLLVSFFSCSKDDGEEEKKEEVAATCLTCDFLVDVEEVCKGSDGDAYIRNLTTGIEFDTYIAGINSNGGSCK